MDFKLTAAGDLDLTNGNTTFIKGKEAVAQHCKLRLQTWAGESSYDTEAGVPYLEGVFGKQPFESVALIIEEVIRETPGVTSVRNVFQSMEYDPDTRELTMRPIITVQDEEVDFSVLITG